MTDVFISRNWNSELPDAFANFLQLKYVPY